MTCRIGGVEIENILPAGEYTISDPCYIIGREKYDRLLEETQCWHLNGGDQRIFTDSATGLRYAIVGTAWGDGVYQDNLGNEYGVDAGCIACVPKSMCDMTPDRYAITRLFETEVEVDYEHHGGVIVFGDIRIMTDADSDDEY